MSMIVRAFPIVARIEEVEQFAAELRARPAETAAFYRQFGVTRESWFVQQSPTGALLINVTIVDDPGEAASEYAATCQAFDTWFKQQVLRLSGIDPNQQPLGPPTTQVFEWSANEG